MLSNWPCLLVDMIRIFLAHIEGNCGGISPVATPSVSVAPPKPE